MTVEATAGLIDFVQSASRFSFARILELFLPG
jgi:hypothetical protein